MTVAEATGAGLGGVFKDLQRHDEPGAEWFAAAQQWSVTMPLHVREHLASSALIGGVMFGGGTVAPETGWAAVAGFSRGSMVTLDAGRLDDEGVWTPVQWRDAEQPSPAVELVVSQATAGALGAFLSRVWRTATLAGWPDATPVAGEEATAAGTATLADLARALVDVPAAVEVERAEVPALSDDPFVNVRRLFALTVGQLARLFGVTERQAHRYLREGLPDSRRALADALVAVGLTVVGGLGADGARAWLFSGTPSSAQLAASGRIAELRDRAEALRDSPAT